MEYVGRPLAAAEADLEARRIPFTVTVTSPDRPSFTLDREQLYVIRESSGPAGEVRLLAAAKMGKGV